MSSFDFKMAGAVHIPSDIQKEFNERILTMLDYCGIRKTTTIDVAGRTYYVTEPVSIDSKGNIEFDHSVLEKEKHEAAVFNVNTCFLSMPERGYIEIELAGVFLMTLCQAYSDTQCYLTYDGKIFSVRCFLQILNYIFDYELPCNNGNDVWELYSFFHYDKDYEDIQPYEAFRSLIKDWDEGITYNQLMTYLILSKDKPPTFKCKTKCIKSKIVDKNLSEKEELLFSLLSKLCDNEEVIVRLKGLLEKNMEERQKEAEDDDDYGLLAELSLYFSAPAIVKYLSLAKGENFWDLWDRLNIIPYKDVIDKPICETPEQYCKVPLYIPIKRDDEDEFLYLWNGDNLKLSEKLIKQIEEWKCDYARLMLTPGLDTEAELAQILFEMENDWNCPFVSRSLVEELLNNKNNVKYQKLLLVLKKFISKGLELFPELTQRQAIEWVLKRSRDPKEAVHIGTFMTLLENTKERQRIFGI